MMDLLEGTWTRVRDAVARDVGERVFGMWFDGVRVRGLARSVLTLDVPTAESRNWILQNYLTLLERRATETVGAPIRIELRVAREALSEAVAEDDASPARVFSTFVPSARTELAMRMLRWTADGRTPTFSPVFVYGPEGTGKSHLAAATVAAAPRADYALFLTADAFTERFTASMKVRRLAEFREQILRSRLLVVDGIDALGSRVATARELASLLSTLVVGGGRAVLTARAHPSNIPHLDARLTSMALSGYVAELDAPSLLERVAIVRSMMRRIGKDAGEAVAVAVVEAEPHSMGRALRLAKKMIAVSAAFGEKLDADFVERNRPGVVNSMDPKSRTVETALGLVCDRFGVDGDALRGKKKIPALALPREVMVWILREHAGMTFRDIGAAVGGRSHTSVFLMHKKFAGRLAADVDLVRLVDETSRRLGSPAP